MGQLQFRSARKTELPGACAKTVRSVKTETMTGREQHTTLSDRTINEINTLIQTRIAEPIYTGELAGIAGMDKASFKRAFVEQSGVTPCQYVRWRRVDLALRLLVDTRFDVAEIAYVSGFSNRPEMSEVFQTTLGIRPRAFRAAN